jgi:hypothetical protein
VNLALLVAPVLPPQVALEDLSGAGQRELVDDLQAQSGSGTPITAHWAPAGWDATAFSTSAEYTFSPPVTIMSLMRSTT